MNDIASVGTAGIDGKRMESTIEIQTRGVSEGGRLDAVVFGATGFTGKFVVGEFLKRAFEDAERIGRQWRLGVAGRSRGKLKAMLETFRHYLRKKDQAPPGGGGIDVDVIVADVNDRQSLAAMCRRTRLVLNCVGPFRYYGEAVVEACVDAGVDYLDITGEAEFMERMEAKYHSKAVDKGSLVVSACGFDSVPADFGVLYTASKFRPPCVPHSVDSYLTFHCGKEGIGGHYGTWETAVMSFRHAESFRQFRVSLPRRLQPNIPGPPPRRQKGLLASFSWEERLQAYALPFPGSDVSVVRRTQQTLWARPKSLLPTPDTPSSSSSSPSSSAAATRASAADDSDSVIAASSSKNADTPTAAGGKALSSLGGEGGMMENFRPVHYGAYFTVKTRWILFLFMLLGGLFQWLATREFGKKLLLKYPRFFSYGLFSHRGPTPEQLRNTSFSMTFVGRGYMEGPPHDKSQRPNLEIVTKLTGPEMGYVGTSIILVQCALTLLERRRELARGGVYTPGAVFGGTDVLKALRSRGIHIDDLSVNRSC